MKLLVISGGNHPYEESTPVLEKFLLDAGHSVTTSWDSSILSDEIKMEQFDALVFNTQRANETALSSQEIMGMKDFIRRGKGFVCIHISGCIPASWKEYVEITGGGWDLKDSFHPPYGKVGVRISQPNHPCVIDVTDFITDDELYMGINYQDGNDVFMYASSQDGTYEWRNKEVFMPGGDFPLGWTRNYGKGRVFVTLLGHDGESFKNSEFQKIVLNGVKWVIGSA
ncbi:MAG: ThuA domain-containing protein [SAR202 cluster bacterium]|nr:ThuA domain-containing protein [SAR202 cluster bacterium]|tara:strand:+ start:7709 stop:8386 length:678 start_codon:yes stop_codon:yes gene_type:complete